jgi:DNA-binding Lrp family transcriptional regulator
MDSMDQQLLGLLRIDARTSIAELSKKLGVARGTIRNRIRRFEDSGLITGYTVRLSSDNTSDGIRAWMSIAIEGDRTREVVRMLLGEPAIVSINCSSTRMTRLGIEVSTSIPSAWRLPASITFNVRNQRPP